MAFNPMSFDPFGWGGDKPTKLAEMFSKGMPNEIAKTSSWTRNIPYIGQALQVLGSLDSGSAAYADIMKGDEYQHLSKKDRETLASQKATSSMFSTLMGGGNPGIYGSQGNIDRNWADYLGMVGGGIGGGYGGALGSIGDIFNAASNKEDEPNYGVAGSGTESSFADLLPILNFARQFTTK